MFPGQARVEVSDGDFLLFNTKKLSQISGPRDVTAGLVLISISWFDGDSFFFLKISFLLTKNCLQDICSEIASIYSLLCWKYYFTKRKYTNV